MTKAINSLPTAIVYTFNEFRNLIKIEAVPNSVPAKTPWINASFLSFIFEEIVSATSEILLIERYAEVKTG